MAVPTPARFEGVMSVPTLARFGCEWVSMSRNGAGSAVPEGGTSARLWEFLCRHEFAFAVELYPRLFGG
jgi:hypothetical protein